MITLPAVFSKLMTRADNSIKIEFETREFGADEIAELLKLRNTEGWLLYSPNKFKDDVTMPDLPADSGRGEKSPSQRLRGAMYVWWQQQGKPTQTFEEFYRVKFEGLIDQVKDKLD